nr:unnamed protein product [Spirometra erinaceieuropaei]
MDAYRDERPGIRIAYRTDSHLLNQQRMHFQSRVSTTNVHDFLHADDCVPNTISEEDMQTSMSLFSVACENCGLVMNTEKTVLWWQDGIPNTDAFERTGILSIQTMLRQLQLRWGGHLVWMDNERLPKRLFYGDVATGSRRQRGQIRRYKDTLKSSLKRLQINPTNWNDLSCDQ